MKLSPQLFAVALLILNVAACEHFSTSTAHSEHVHEAMHKVIVTTPVTKDIISTQQYVCQIHSCRHIEVRALESGYLEPIPVNEGQSVKQGDVIFKILPTLYQAKLDSENAEAQLAQIEFNNTQKLFQQSVVSQQEVALAQAKLAKAQANVKLARAELNFTDVRAPFDGIIDRLYEQQGSLVAEGDRLTTLSDNSVMWVYFNVPEARYLEYKREMDKGQQDLKVELLLAGNTKFEYEGKIGAIEADFNNETGNIAFRADFPNPQRLLRHGQTGTILISRVVKDAVVIPQRATYEILAKKYAYVVTEPSPEALHEQASATSNDELTGVHPTAAHEQQLHASLDSHRASDAEHSESSPEHAAAHEHNSTPDAVLGIVHQREIVILNEQEDIYLIKEGLNVNDKIVLEGIQQVRDGEEIEYEYRNPEDVLNHLKNKAE